MGLPKKRFGRRDGLISLVEPVLFYGIIASVLFYAMMPYLYYAKNESLLVLGFFALWRYGWLLLNFARAFIYAKVVFPRLKKKIANLDESKKYPDHLYFSIPSYKEESWVSIETFKSIMNELSTVPSSATIIVSTSGDPQEDSVIYETCKAHYAYDKVELVFQHQKEGKRVAMGHSMRAIARRYYKKEQDYNSVTFFMDGDSYLEKGFFQKLLPHFAIDHELGALTTNEAAFIHTNSNWYKDWFNLKFGQRHLLFQSHSLSNKVLTLTGRLSAYRTDLIVQDKFITKVENDIITTVMNGKFRFLMGDDKTTWFNLLSSGWKMRYLPDTLCYSLESRDADFLDLSRSLPYRWYGNTLRNSDRALALGPKRIKSFFIWWAILDQRISMWTSLVGITGAIILGLSKVYFYFVFYIVWVLYVRIFQIIIIAYNGHPVSMRTIPLMLYTQWLGSFVKIKALFHLSDQQWSKGNDVQSNDDSIAKIDHPLFNYMPDYLMTFSYVLFIYIMLLSHNAMAFPDFDLTKEDVFKMKKEQFVYANQHGIIPNDDEDDSLALNMLIEQAKKGDIIVLPEGVLDLYHSVNIRKSNITIQGASKEKTIIVSHLIAKDVAAFYVQGTKMNRIGYLKKNVHYKDSVLYARLKRIKNLKWIKIREKNDKKFLASIKSKIWNQQYPYLRQEITSIVSYKDDLAFLGNALSTTFSEKDAEIYALDMLEHVTLKNFTIKQIIDGENIEETRGKYQNLFSDYLVDLVRLEYVANSNVENVKILNAGRHPLVFENVFNCRATKLYIDGAWNKGKKGTGYVRLARAFSSEIGESTIKNIRHLTLQWSSANNLIHDLKMGVDINFHGGYDHDNLVKHIIFDIPAYHKWDPITNAPLNATWASPDGPRNIVKKITITPSAKATQGN